MTWQQITITCPYCRAPIQVHQEFTHIRLACGACGGFYHLTPPADGQGLPTPVKADPPEVTSQRDTGGWRAYRGVMR